MSARWQVKPSDSAAALRLSAELGISALSARVLAARGFADSADARAFLSGGLPDLPDPLGIPGMRRAVDRLIAAVRAGEQVWIYTDFDADGVTSAALLLTFFRAIDVPVRAWLPRRDREGYGLHVEPLEEIAREGGGVVVTADCGITAVEPALAARRLGLGLIITDHHTPAEALPDADAVVNPKLDGGSYPDPMIAGVGVAWNLVAALRRRLRDEGWFTASRPEPELKSLLDLVALGTVADLAPLKAVNRILVRSGLMGMNRDPRPGIQALAEVAGMRGEIRAGHLSFQLGPRINAAGRMEGPHEAVDLLLAPSLPSARPLASQLDRLNRERREEEASTLAAAIRSVDAEGRYPSCASLVVHGAGYHPGVVGIVASRLVERYFRPSVVFSINGDVARGSARSIPGLDLYATLQETSGLLIRFGGHRAAAGLTIATDRILEFREAFEAAVATRLSSSDFTKVTEADAEPGYDELDPRSVADLARLEPFGFGNPTPLFLLRGLRVRDRSQLSGEAGHVRLQLENGLWRGEAMAWGMAPRLGFAATGSRIDLMGTLKLREWKGRMSVQITVEDARPAEAVSGL